MTELKASGVGEAPPPYMIFLVVFLFFLTGLLGFLICHLLKKKGYRCRTGDMEDEEEENLGENEDDENDENQDTVEQILKCIIENEANMEAFNEMLGNHNVCVRHDPRLRKESIGGVPPHLHTVHSGTDHNSCLLCAQVQSKKGRRQSRTPRFKQRPGEQTVFSVGRFRVIHTDKKLHGGPNPLAISGDQLDQSQDSEERKEGGYNLKSMFKEVQLPSDGANGIAASVGKQKKSVTIFGLRRGSDPLGLKPKDGKGREAGGVRFAFRQPPLVLEEPLQAENPETGFVDGTEPGSKTKTEVQFEAKRSTPVNSPSIKSKERACDSSSGLQEGPKPNEMVKPYSQSAVVSAPTSLPGLSDRRVNVDDEVLKTEEAYITGPVQTSTPIAPMPATSPGFSTSRSSGQPHLHSNKDLLVVQMSSDLRPSPDQEASIGADLIRLGPSPQSSFPSKTLSSVSSLKSPTSSLSDSPSPKSSSRNVASESAITPSTTPANQNLALTGSPRPAWKSERTTTGGSVTNSGSRKEPKPGEHMVLKADEKTEIKGAEILKPDSKSGLFCPSDLSLKDGPSSLALSPSGSLSPSSPKGSRTSSAAILKASPHSSREFSVVPVLEEEESSSSVKPQKNETGGDFDPERPRDPMSQSMETSGAEVRSTLGQAKEDLVEMEDIRHCKVTQRSQDQEGEHPKDEGLMKRKGTTLQTER